MYAQLLPVKNLDERFFRVVVSVYTNSMAPEPDGSSPHSQQPATGPYLEPGQSTPHTPKPIFLRSILIPSSQLRP
jgi:hypothetical protein